MNSLAFIASVVGSLAVPIAVVIVLAIFRRPLAELIGRVSSYEGMGQKLTFGRKLASTEAAVSVAVEQAQAAARQTADEAAVEAASSAYGVETDILSPIDSNVASGQTTPDTSDPLPSSESRPESGTTEEDRALREITSAKPNIEDVDLKNAGLVQLAKIASSNPSFTIIKAFDELTDAIKELAEIAQAPADTRDTLYQLAYLEGKRAVETSFAIAVMDLDDLRDRVAHGQHNPTAGEAVTYVESVRKLVEVASDKAAYLTERLRALERTQELFEAQIDNANHQLAEWESTDMSVEEKRHLQEVKAANERHLRNIRSELKEFPSLE